MEMIEKKFMSIVGPEMWKAKAPKYFEIFIVWRFLKKNLKRKDLSKNWCWHTVDENCRCLKCLGPKFERKLKMLFVEMLGRFQLCGKVHIRLWYIGIGETMLNVMFGKEISEGFELSSIIKLYLFNR